MQTFEIEIKFRVTDFVMLQDRLRQRFGTLEFGEQVLELDAFFQHPCRDFVQTDECLRLRTRTFKDDTLEHSLTYKGPKIDASTKTRHEIEMPIHEPQRWESLFTALGFRAVASIQKFRRRMTLTLEHRQVDIVLDTLPALPESARHFVEIETLATEEEIEECRLLILSLAEQLGLNEPIRDSYLKLLDTCCTLS